MNSTLVAPFTEGTFVATLTVGQMKEIFSGIVKEEIINKIPLPPDKLNTPKETAKCLGITVPTLSQYEKDGKIEATRLSPRKVFYKDSAIASALTTLKRIKKTYLE